MSGRSNIIIIAIILIVLAIVGGAYVNVLSGGNAITWADPENQELVAGGKTIYTDTCAECHGENLEGQPNWRIKNEDGTLPAPPHDASGHTWHHPDELLFQITKDGGQKNAPEGFKSGMPEFADTLSDKEIWSVLAYIKSQWPDEIIKRHAQMSERMKAN